MERKHYVYALFRPDTGGIFYIGMGKGLRYAYHVKCRKRGRSRKDNLICKLIDDLGYPDIPVVFVRDGMTVEEAWDLERALILAIGRYPHGPLLNMTAGGEGLCNPSLETRAKLSAIRSAANRGKTHLAETRVKLSAALKGKIRSAEHRAKMSAAQKGKTLSTETRAKLIAANKGRTPSAETRAKMSAAQKGKIFSTEHKAKLSAALKGRTPILAFKGKTHSAEARAKISAANNGRTPSAETRAKISAANKRRAPAFKGKAHLDETRAKISAANKGKTRLAETRAKISASKKGIIWINNGSKTRTIHGPEIPDGWVRGRI